MDLRETSNVMHDKQIGVNRMNNTNLVYEGLGSSETMGMCYVEDLRLEQRRVARAKFVLGMFA